MLSSAFRQISRCVHPAFMALAIYAGMGSLQAAQVQRLEIGPTGQDQTINILSRDARQQLIITQK